jgi:hypothetical protein
MVKHESWEGEATQSGVVKVVSRRSRSTPGNSGPNMTEQWPEQNNGQNRTLARTEHWPEQNTGQNRTLARTEQWPEQNNGQNRTMARAPSSRMGRVPPRGELRFIN